MCIDQGDPVKKQKGINCLPIFLTGCQRLLIVAGPTYCSRLWCVMEIFTFMRMGGTQERIEVNMITHKDHTHPAAAKKELKKQFATFDAAKAECFLPKDKHRLLAVVEAGFGDFEEFNVKVRTAFAERLEAPASRTRRKRSRAKDKLTVATAKVRATSAWTATLASAGQVELQHQGVFVSGLASAGEERPDEVQQEAV